MKNSLFFGGLLLAILSFSCGQGDQPFSSYLPDPNLKITHENKISDRFVNYTFFSPSIAQNKVDDTGESRFSVYLPKSYTENQSRVYPVVYGLHGYGDSSLQFTLNVNSLLDNDPNSPECIIVSINGTNILSGSFYANSNITGNWEDMVANEVRYLVDEKFRTIKSSKARMVAGFSMGGFGAWNIGLKRPDVFGYVWALCPGAFEPGAIKEGIRSWSGFPAFFSAYAACFAPDESQPKPFYKPLTYNDLNDPQFDSYLKKLESGFGDIDGKVALYQKLGRKLNAVKIDYGNQDGFTWIPKGSEYLFQALKKAGENVLIQVHDDGHIFDNNYVIDGFIPFLKESFK